MGSIMTSNATPNSAEAALKGPGFADVLSMSLSNAIPSVDVSSPSRIPSHLLPNSEISANRRDNIPNESVRQIQVPQTAVTETPLSPKKSTKRQENASSGNSVIGNALKGFHSSDSLDSLQPSSVDNSVFLNLPPKNADISADVPKPRTSSSEQIQNLQGIAEDNLETDRSLETPLAQREVSGALSSFHANASSTNIASTAQHSLPIGPEPDKGSGKYENRSLPPTNLSQPNSTNRIVSVAAPTGDIQAPELQTHPLGQPTTPPPQPDPQVDGANSARTQSATHSAPLPAMFVATSNVPPNAEHSPRSNALSSDDQNRNGIGASKELASGTSNQNLSSSEMKMVLLAPSVAGASLAGTKPTDRQPVQVLESMTTVSITAPTTPLALTEISVESGAIAEMPANPSFKIEAPTNIKKPSLPDLFGSLENKLPYPKMDLATLSSDEGSRNDKGKNTANSTASSAPIAEATTPVIPLSEAVSAEAPKAASFPELLNSTKALDSNPKTDPAPLSTDERTRKDAGKTLASRALTSTAEGPSETPQASAVKTVNADALKLGLTAVANPAQAAGTDVSSQTAGKLADGPKTVNHRADPSGKDGSQNGGIDSSNVGDRQADSIQSSQLTFQIGKSGVKIAMQGEQFGGVELHAKVMGDRVSASITVDHHETHALLSSDLPVLQQILSERQLRVSEIILLHNSLASSNPSDGGPAAKREDASPRHANAPSGSRGTGSSIPSSAANGQAVENAIFDSRGRLSVRA